MVSMETGDLKDLEDLVVQWNIDEILDEESFVKPLRLARYPYLWSIIFYLLWIHRLKKLSPSRQRTLIFAALGQLLGSAGAHDARSDHNNIKIEPLRLGKVGHGLNIFSLALIR